MFQLFRKATDLQSLDWKYTLVASMLEIYCGSINDLKGIQKYEIKVKGTHGTEDKVDEVYVTDESHRQQRGPDSNFRSFT